MTIESELTFRDDEKIDARAVLLTAINTVGITITQGNRTLVVPLSNDEALTLASGLHVAYATTVLRAGDAPETPRATVKEVGHA